MSVKNKQKAIIPTKDIFDLVHSEGETVEHKVSQTIYYEQKYAKFKDKSIFISWNWAAFFFGTVWLWYRKMYAYFFASASFLCVIELLIKYRLASEYSKLEGFVYRFAGFFIFNILIFGIFGNAMYFRFLRTKYINHVHCLGTNHWLVTLIATLAIGYYFNSVCNLILAILSVILQLPEGYLLKTFGF